jgi:hypothetical protein
VAAVLGLSPATTAALAELERRRAVEQERLQPADAGRETPSVSAAFVDLENAYSGAKRRVLGGMERINRFEEAMSAAYNDTLSVLPGPLPAPDPDGKFTIHLLEPGLKGSGPDHRNRYDPLFDDVH